MRYIIVVKNPSLIVGETRTEESRGEGSSSVWVGEEDRSNRKENRSNKEILVKPQWNWEGAGEKRLGNASTVESRGTNDR